MCTYGIMIVCVRVIIAYIRDHDCVYTLKMKIAYVRDHNCVHTWSIAYVRDHDCVHTGSWLLTYRGGHDCVHTGSWLRTYKYCMFICFMPCLGPRTLISDNVFSLIIHLGVLLGGGPRVVVSTAAFHARVRGSVPGLGGLKETKLFLPHPRVKVSIVGSLRDREVACSASDRQGANFESCVWRTVSSQSSHHPQEVLLAQFSLYVHKGGLKPDSFHLEFY